MNKNDAEEFLEDGIDSLLLLNKLTGNNTKYG